MEILFWIIVLIIVVVIIPIHFIHKVFFGHFPTIRHKFIWFIARVIFEVPEGDKFPKLLLFICHLLFPLNWWYAKQSRIRLDMSKNVLIINGLRFSMGIFDFFADKKNVGKIFQIIENKDGDLTLKSLPDSNPEPEHRIIKRQL